LPYTDTMPSFADLNGEQYRAFQDAAFDFIQICINAKHITDGGVTTAQWIRGSSLLARMVELAGSKPEAAKGFQHFRNMWGFPLALA